MKTISLAIDDVIFEETETILSKDKKPRNRYINEALKYYNQIQKKILLENRLRNESYAVQESSMEVLREFEAIEL
jgi:hypothetical protein